MQKGKKRILLIGLGFLGAALIVGAVYLLVSGIKASNDKKQEQLAEEQFQQMREENARAGREAFQQLEGLWQIGNENYLLFSEDGLSCKTTYVVRNGGAHQLQGEVKRENGVYTVQDAGSPYRLTFTLQNPDTCSPDRYEVIYRVFSGKEDEEETDENSVLTRVESNEEIEFQLNHTAVDFKQGYQSLVNGLPYREDSSLILVDNTVYWNQFYLCASEGRQKLRSSDRVEKLIMYDAAGALTDDSRYAAYYILYLKNSTPAIQLYTSSAVIGTDTVMTPFRDSPITLKDIGQCTVSRVGLKEDESFWKAVDRDRLKRDYEAENEYNVPVYKLDIRTTADWQTSERLTADLQEVFGMADGKVVGSYQPDRKKTVIETDMRNEVAPEDAAVIASGETEKFSWTLASDDTFTVTAQGELEIFYGDKAALGSILQKYADSIQNLVIGEGVTSILGSFSTLTNLTQATLPNSLTVIGDNAFRGCTALRGILIPEGVTEIGMLSFNGCTSLEELQLPAGLTKMGNNVFQGCSSLAFVHIPDKVTEISDAAFYGCSNLKSAELPAGLTRIGRGAFAYCYSLQSVQIPDGVTIIEEETFKDCSLLQQAILPDSLEQIWDQAFSGCSALTEFTIPANVIRVGKNALYNTPSLKTLYINGSTDGWSKYNENWMDELYTGDRNIVYGK